MACSDSQKPAKRWYKTINFNEICQKINSLIKSIFVEHKVFEEATNKADRTVSEATSLFVEAMKELAPIQIKHRGIDLGLIGSQQLVWHKDYGIGVVTGLSGRVTQFAPLTVSKGDFPLEKLIELVYSQLDPTLQKITSKTEEVIKRTERFEQLIELLKQWEEDVAESEKKSFNDHY